MNWILEKGDFRLIIGSNSDDEKFEKIVHLAETKKINPGSRCLYATGIEKKVEEKDGYLYFSGEWRDGEHLSIEFPMPVSKIYCNTAVRENENCVALMRGPVVYCFEGKDNPWPLQELRIPEKTVFAAESKKYCSYRSRPYFLR